MQNFVHLEDDLFQVGQSREGTFALIETVRTFEDDYADDGEFGGLYCSIYLRYDDNYYSYDRDQYTVMEFLGDVGGL